MTTPEDKSPTKPAGANPPAAARPAAAIQPGQPKDAPTIPGRSKDPPTLPGRSKDIDTTIPPHSEGSQALYLRVMTEQLTGWNDPRAMLERALKENLFLLLAQRIL